MALPVVGSGSGRSASEAAVRESNPLAGRVPELDGFRAIAVWMVLGSHLIGGWALPDGALAGMPRPVLWVLEKGWLGVDLFFVLSGLLITGILFDSRERPGYYRNFYGRRFLRIIPLYMAVIAITFLAYRHPVAYFLISILFLANLASVIGIATPHGPGVFWSLAVEEHFYLGWPLLVRRLSRRSLVWVLFAIVGVSPVLRGSAVAMGFDAELIVYPLSVFRFDGMALGALLAIWIRSPESSVRRSLQLAGAMLAVSLIIVVCGIPFGVMGTKTVGSTALRYTHMQMFFASAVLASLALSGTAWTAVLRTPFLRVSSDLSYCIYLIHLSVGDGYHWLLKELQIDVTRLTGPRGALLCQTVFVLGATFGLAALSKRYLEEPCLRLKRYFV